MKSSIGVWIDKSQARIISPTALLETISSDIEIRPRYEGEGKEYGRFGNQYMTLEKTKQHRLEQQEMNYLKTVINTIKDSERILIFGPAQVKNKLEHLLEEDYATKGKVIDVVAAEKMTDKQLVAFVREYYGELDK
ncbi:MAG: hypothetical protein KDC85_14835 [Saprospiraceae bacterium]|nr:hypothetical protein [Saprospiraceae bacterium]MCB9323830.1 hypothetical protein [Lewinellaceae bacterium]